MIVNFVCRESKKLVNGLCPIELSIIIGGKRKYLTLDRRIKPKSFDPKRQRVKGDKETTDYLEAVRSRCFQVETEMIKAVASRTRIKQTKGDSIHSHIKIEWIN